MEWLRVANVSKEGRTTSQMKIKEIKAIRNNLKKNTLEMRNMNKILQYWESIVQ